MNSQFRTSLSSNERLILDLIRRQGAVSRVDIAKVVDLTGASVTRLTRQLSDRGLVSESAVREARPGQPSRPLRLKAEGGYGIGLNFSHATIEVGLVDLTGVMLDVVSGPIDAPTLDKISEEARQIVDAMLRKHHVKRERVVGIGVSVPGYYSKTPNHFAVHPAFPTLLFRNLARDLESNLGIRTIVERDAVSAAVGESLVGGGRDRTSFAFIYLGHGIGGAMILDGHPFHGVHGNAGAMGALFPRDAARPSGEDLLGHLWKSGLEIRDFDDLKALNIEECLPLREWIDRAATQLRAGLSIIGRLFDPAMIVLGGRLPTPICEALVSRIGELERPQGYTDDLPLPAVISSFLGPRSGVLGAGCLPLFETFFSQRQASSRSSSGGVDADLASEAWRD